MAEEQTADFAQLLRQARRVAGLSQEELAERAGLSARAISALERGINRAPRRDTLDMLAGMGIAAEARIGLCPSVAFFMYDGIRRLGAAFEFVNAACVIDPCRFHKSATELALMQRAKDMTLEVHKAAASILREGISTTEVAEFIQPHPSLTELFGETMLSLTGRDFNG